MVKINDDYIFPKIQINNKPLVKLRILLKFKFFSKKKEILLENFAEISGNLKINQLFDSELVDGW